MTWSPLGARVVGDGVVFRVWSPSRKNVDIVFERSACGIATLPLQRGPDGIFEGHLPGGRPGDLYKLRLDGGDCFPDPFSLFQPKGVHGPSQVIDLAHPWRDTGWKNRPLTEYVIYELHLGTFSPEGTYTGARKKLPYLAELGVTAVELMPLADFPGQRGWGYDGVSLFAPARCYGSPEELRQFVEDCHAHGLAVLLDVVYNHLGPDGNYVWVISREFYSTRHKTLWGPCPDFDGEHAEIVRNLLIDNALHWLRDYHFDGLRLDATAAIVDDSEPHFLAELNARVKAGVPDRAVYLFAEDSRNDRQIVLPASAGGWGLDSIWADDFHHQFRRVVAGDHEGYYQDFSDSVVDLARVIEKGWLYCGEYSHYWKAPRGTDTAGLPRTAFTICIQNHDQVGNRALGERLHHEVDLAVWRAASVLFVQVPFIPLLFMGQEWAASTPFLFFTDHNPELGAKVTEGRREEFKHYSAFTDPHRREKIPDPQAESTYLASKLLWEEQERSPHAGILRLYRELLRQRRLFSPLSASGKGAGGKWFRAIPLEENGVLVVLSPSRVVVCWLKGAGTVELADHLADVPPGSWQVLLSTEDPAWCEDARPIRVECFFDHLTAVTFRRPGAIVLQRV